MSKKFKFKLQSKRAKLNLKSNEVKKIVLKFIGIYGSKKIKFYTKISIKLNCIANILNGMDVVKNINIEELKIDEALNEKNSECRYNNYYTLCTSSDSSSDSSCISSSEIYNSVMSFIKNIKFTASKNKLENAIFSLKNTNIKKIKVKGKIYQ